MKGSMSESQVINRMANILFTVECVILLLAYGVQFAQGSKTAGNFAILAVTDILPVIICWVIYKMNPGSTKIRHFMGIGFGIFYAFSCFTSNEQMVFTYAIPMILVVTLFNDAAFSFKISVGVAAISVGHSIWYTAGQNWTSEAVAALEIEAVVMVIICVYSVTCNKLIARLNGDKVTAIDAAGEKTGTLLEQVMSISEKMIEEVSVISDKMTQLTASSEETLASMQEVQSGTTDSAESIQNQLVKTEEIQTQIEKVTNATNSISTNVDASVDACHAGRENIEKLMKQSEISEKAGSEVMKDVEGLKNSTEQMESIVALIKSVASQTSLLALNASIEAARAGEAGRGFAVVATEISDLAGQTSSATGSISELIEGISRIVNEVVTAISSLVESNKVQNESATVTSGSFEKIVDSVKGIREDSQTLSSVVTRLAAANQEIVESIQTISAITEEVSAHSTTTCEATQQNEAIVEDVQRVVEEMINNAEKLSSLKK